jgi:hypothetical protein
MLLPYRTHVFESALVPAQVLERLNAAVQPMQWVRSRQPAERPFEGTIDGSTFRIQRAIRYRNSFLPRLHGRIEPMPDGRARVVVAFQLHPAVAVFMAVWFGFLIMIGGGALAYPSSGSGDSAPRWILLGMLAFGVVLILGAFIPEAHKARQLLQDIFRARPGTG